MNPQDLPESFPPGLSSNPRKPYYYGREIYFREAWQELAAALTADPADVFRGHTFVLFKPDGVVARAPKRALPILAARGFRPLSAFVVRFDRFMTRELWRYELNRATLERMVVVDKLLELGPCLLLLVRDGEALRGEISAAERMTIWKGSSRGDLGPETFRGAIGASRGLLNLIHTPDDTADVIRELGVLLTREQRAGVAAALVGEADDDAIVAALAECDATLADGPTKWPPLVRELKRLAEAQLGRLPAQLAGLLREAEVSGPRASRHILAACAEAGVSVPRITAVLMEASCVASDIPGIVPIFDALDLAAS